MHDRGHKVIQPACAEVCDDPVLPASPGHVLSQALQAQLFNAVLVPAGTSGQKKAGISFL